MHAVVGSIGQPEFLFVGCKSNAVAWAAMALYRSFLKATDLHTMQRFSGLQIPDLEPEQFIHIHKNKSLASVDREGTYGITKWPDCMRFLVRGWIRDGEQG